MFRFCFHDSLLCLPPHPPRWPSVCWCRRAALAALRSALKWSGSSTRICPWSHWRGAATSHPAPISPTQFDRPSLRSRHLSLRLRLPLLGLCGCCPVRWFHSQRRRRRVCCLRARALPSRCRRVSGHCGWRLRRGVFKSHQMRCFVFVVVVFLNISDTFMCSVGLCFCLCCFCDFCSSYQPTPFPCF